MQNRTHPENVILLAKRMTLHTQMEALFSGFSLLDPSSEEDAVLSQSIQYATYHLCEAVLAIILEDTKSQNVGLDELWSAVGENWDRELATESSAFSRLRKDSAFFQEYAEDLACSPAEQPADLAPVSR